MKYVKTFETKKQLQAWIKYAANQTKTYKVLKMNLIENSRYVQRLDKHENDNIAKRFMPEIVVTA